jgi:hypothetical protein
MDINCVYYQSSGLCRLSRCACNRLFHYTCFFEQIMEKAMIPQPMRGKTEKQVREER